MKFTSTKFEILKKTFAGIFLSFIACAIIFSFGYTMVRAQTTNPDYTVLAPLPGTTEEPCDGASEFCTATLFGQNGYLQGIFNLSIGVGAVVAFVLITIAGFEYMFTDSLNIKTKAKENLVNVAWGLGIVLFAYVILYTVSPNLVNGNLFMASPVIAQPTAAVTASSGTGAPGTGTGNGSYANYVLTTNVDASATESATASANENTMRASLDQPPYNITVNNAPCASLSSTGCTDVGGLTANTVSQVENLAAQCGCNPQITGGNEPNGHDAASHPAGNGVDFDTASDPNLTTYLVNATGIPNPPVVGTTYSGVTLNGQQVNILYETLNTQVTTGGSVSTGDHVHITFAN